MTYGTSLGVSMPAVGAAGPGTALATQINTCVDAIIDRLETKVTVAGLDINADLSIRSGSTNYGLTNVHRVSLADALSALSAVTYPGALYRVGNDLYFNDAAGNQVRIVTAGALDTAVVGGITGSGYGVGGIEFNWTGARFRARLGTGTDDFADIEVNDILLRDGSSNAIRLNSPVLSADYTVTFPAGPPAAEALLVMGNTGIVTAPATYASGTFTPILQNAGSDHGGGYSTQAGSYVRIGNLVFFHLQVVATSLDPTGTLRIKASSLPVAPSTATVALQGCVCSQFTGSDVEGTTGRINADGIYLQSDNDLGDGTAVFTDWSLLGSATRSIQLSGHYLVA